MAQFRKKPVVVSAMRISAPMTVETLEGTMRGNPGDFLITGIKGEHYFCKADIFTETYEPADAEAQLIMEAPPVVYAPKIKIKTDDQQQIKLLESMLQGLNKQQAESNDQPAEWNRFSIGNKHTRQDQNDVHSGS